VVISEGAEFEACDWSRACIINNMKYVIVTQSSSEWVWPDDRNIASVRDHYIKARACYFVSGENLKNIEMKTGVKLTNAKIVRNPFRVDYDSDLSWPVNDKVLRLACVAAAEPSRKGQDVLLQVLSQNKWRERPVLCDFFDYGGSCHGLLKNISDLFRLGNTRFIESITNVRDIWETHHALILPSRREGLPLALVEAMLCGRLCIVTNVGGSAEIMEDNITGFIAQMPTPAALDEAMERAWQRRSEWETMGRFAAQKIREIIPSEPDVAFLNELKLIL
jgi:glycosyltransferase involved in cell wall biosynthesis